MRRRKSGNEIGTRCTQVHIPSVEDRYILLEITILIDLHGSLRRRVERL
jgi:hypothetical protein